ncbi:hypothetical protein EYY80_09495 [Klebsiella oxytoca]|jgi:hypothetical protein|nr:hypothetical protein CEQ13_04885 [Klebsiella oxytoca]EUC86477.1 hypothetical protein HMPREF1570_0792 [Klebsiella oxytoca KA-2]AWF36881.1 hypothetical protein CSC17_3593 [Klebsiella oxytoca]AYZ52550.1 hypothetical protein EGY21_14600 [Klebsiella oxytoca]MBX4510366.1 hypothetical protein [Klebsiella oxytoca]
MCDFGFPYGLFESRKGDNRVSKVYFVFYPRMAEDGRMLAGKFRFLLSGSRSVTCRLMPNGGVMNQQ